MGKNTLFIGLGFKSCLDIKISVDFHFGNNMNSHRKASMQNFYDSMAMPERN